MKMTKVIIDEMNKIYKLLSKHKFSIIGDVNDNYKCGICKNILINGQQAICGCNFCYECINQYLDNGGINCPNNTEECGLESLSNVVPNYIINIRISKLMVQCPNKMCSCECQLIEMENHINSCSKKGVKCPFNDVGCEHDDMISDKLNDHMLSDIHNHNKILIYLIGNLRNEMQELKDKVNSSRLEIAILKDNDRKKDETMELIKEEMKLIKKENENLIKQMEVGNQDLWYKFNEINTEIREIYNIDSIESINNEMEIMRMGKEELEQQIKIVESNIDGKYNVEINMRLSEELNEKMENFKHNMRVENEKYQMEVTNKIEKINKYLNMRDNGEFEWKIGQLNQINYMTSEYFYDQHNPYKMRLLMRNINNELNIWLFIVSGAFDDNLTWPCQVNVKIIIYALGDEYKCKSVAISYRMEKPKCFTQSDPIKISHSDLLESNLINISCKLCCSVNFV